MKKVMMIAAAMMLAASPAQAQEVEPKKGEGAETVQLFMVNVPPPHRKEFMERVKTMMEIREAAGLPEMTMLETMNGDHDFIFMTKIEGGMGSLDWDVSPEEAKFTNAAIARFGSQEAWQEWNARWYEVVGGRPHWVYAHKR